MESKNFFEKKIQPAILYIGLIGAIISSIGYIALVIVLIQGFKVQAIKQTLAYAIVNAIVGLIIANFLKYQGTAFAENLPENKKIKEEYFSDALKETKYKDISYFWATSLIKDIIFKGITLFASTAGLIYIVIKGSQDYSLLLMAFVNLLLFISFGLLSLSKAYNYYNNIYVNFMKQQIEKRRLNNNDNNKRENV